MEALLLPPMSTTSISRKKCRYELDTAVSPVARVRLSPSTHVTPGANAPSQSSFNCRHLTRPHHKLLLQYINNQKVSPSSERAKERALVALSAIFFYLHSEHFISLCIYWPCCLCFVTTHLCLPCFFPMIIGCGSKFRYPKYVSARAIIQPRARQRPPIDQIEAYSHSITAKIDTQPEVQYELNKQLSGG